MLIYDVPEVMVNLKGTSKKRILRLHINLMYETTHKELAEVRFLEKTPELKDTLTTLLTEKTLVELESREDLNRLRVELKDELNKVVFPDGLGEVKKVYYQDFIVQ